VTLQSTKFVKQLNGILIKRYVQLLQRILEDDPEMLNEMSKVLNNIAKADATETQDKLPQNKITSHSFRLESARAYWPGRIRRTAEGGPKRIFFLANVGQTIENLKKSVFIEKLTARGYEVLWLNDAM